MSAPELFNPAGVAPPAGLYNHGSFVNAGSELLFLAGQVGMRPDGTVPAAIGEQAECSPISYAS